MSAALDVEIERRDLPTCAICRKQSDGAKRSGVKEIDLCGTHFDSWLRSHEKTRLEFTGNEVHFADFVRRVQAEWRNGK